MRPFTQRLSDRTHLSVTVALRVSHTASQSSYVTSQHTQQGAQADEGCEDLVHARLIPTDIQVTEQSNLTSHTVRHSFLLYITVVHISFCKMFLNHYTESSHLLSSPILSYPIL